MSGDTSALHHLKMAWHYLQQATDFMANDSSGSAQVDALNIPLSQAANHMNKAREIDPDQVLWVESKPGEGFNFSQDLLNARILACEGIAALNAANDYEVKNDNHKAQFNGKEIRGFVEGRQQQLIRARDAFEKALKYSAANKDALTHLTTVYSDLRDTENYKRLLQTRIRIYPDDMQAHMFLENFTGFPAPERKRFWTVGKLLLLTFVVGFVLAAVGGNTNSSTIGGTGALLIVASIVLWFVSRFIRTYVS